VENSYQLKHNYTRLQ